MLSRLVIVSSLLQFVIVRHLSLLRRIFTPVISGTAIMLLSATIMPVVLGLLDEVPAGTPPVASPAVAAVTLVVVVGLALRGSLRWQSWSPLIGILSGCGLAAMFDLFDTGRVVDAAWVGSPGPAWPGLELAPGPKFWALVPAFLVVTLISSIKTVAAGISLQQISRRHPRATEYRIVQRALNTEGIGSLLSGITGTMSNPPDPSGFR